MSDPSDCHKVWGYDITVRVWSDQDHGFPHIFTSAADARQAAHDTVQRLIAPMVPEENAKVDAWASGVTCDEGCDRVLTKVGPTPISYTYSDVNDDVVQCTGRFDVGTTVVCEPKTTVPKEFDIRRLVRDAQADDDIIQSVYDTVNRMVVLLHGIPFSSLFREPLASLVPRVLPHVREAVRRGLLRDGDAVMTAAEELRSLSGLTTVEDLLCRSQHEIPAGVVPLVVRLRRSGIRIPIPALDDGKSDARRQALNELLTHGGDLAFIDLFTRPMRDMDKAAVAAIRELKSLGLFSCLNNDRCCARGAGEDGIRDLCNSHPDSWCNLTGQDGELCSIASEHCKPKVDHETAA